MDTLPLWPQEDNLKPFYVYTLEYPESMGGRVFYVGKGTGNRIDAHELEARRKKHNNPYKCNTIRKIWHVGEQIVKRKLAFFDSEDEAFLYEIALISLMDGLTNLAEGGKGFFNPSEEIRRKRSEALLGRNHTEEARRKMSVANKGKVISEKQRIHLREARLGKVNSEETRRKISQANTGREYPNRRVVSRSYSVSEETRRKISQANTGRSHSEETKRKIGMSNKGKIISEEARQHLREVNTGKVASEETRRKMSESRQDPSQETRRKISTAMQGNQYAKGLIHSEETRRKISETGKGRVHSEETKQKMREAALKREARKRGG